MGRFPHCNIEHTRKGFWTKEEDQCLINYIKLHGEGCWQSLPKAAGLFRTGESCRRRWIKYLRPNLKLANFTELKDELIIKLPSLRCKREICDPPIGDGGSASVHVTSNRFPRCNIEHTRKGFWTKEEDQCLINYIKLHGEGCWQSLPKAAGLFRTGESCRRRWIKYLRPNLKLANFTELEDELIIKLPSLLRKLEICDPPIGDGGSASVHVASNRVTRDLNAVKKEDAAAANSISESSNFSRWEKGESIGSGGYGFVYVARNRETRALCAVKELKDIHKLENIKSIKKEIKILRQLEHPNIVKYYAHEIDNRGCISLYMEFIQPGSLAKYIKKRGALPEPLIRNFTAQILSGLVYLHSKRVVHRDLKPDNILVDSQDVVKLVDFGVSKHMAESVGNHSMFGTLYYAAPEVFDNKIEYQSSREACAADIWSLGCVIIKMFSGKHPWPGFNPVQAACNVSVKMQRPTIPDGLSREGEEFVKRCFIRTPADRPSAAALLGHPFVKQHLSC